MKPVCSLQPGDIIRGNDQTFWKIDSILEPEGFRSAGQIGQKLHVFTISASQGTRTIKFWWHGSKVVELKDESTYTKDEGKFVCLRSTSSGERFFTLANGRDPRRLDNGTIGYTILKWCATTEEAQNFLGFFRRNPR